MTKGNIFKTMLKFFEDDDWTVSILEDESALVTGFEGDNGRWKCYAKARCEQQQVIFYSLFPTNVPEDKRLTIAELIARANYGIVLGNFELDFDDGEVRYKTSIDVEGDRLSLPLMERIVYANVEAMDEYFLALQSVINGEISPEDAIKQIDE